MSEWKNRSREYKKRHAARRLIENLTIEEKDAVRRKWLADVSGDNHRDMPLKSWRKLLDALQQCD